MKKINFFFFLLALSVSANFFTSCSGDSEVVATPQTGTDASAYLKSYYGQEVRMGKSGGVKVNGSSILDKTATSAAYIVTEVFVGDEKTAHIYDVADKATGTPLFFVDVDRDKYTAKVVDYATSESLTLVDINLSPAYGSSHQFDLIHVITDPGYSDPPQYQTLGWHYTYGSPYTYQGKCYKAVFRQYFVLGIAFSDVKAVEDPGSTTGLALAIPCDMTYDEWLDDQK